MDHLSMIFALLGSRSQIWMPGTFVRIAPNAPRNSAGASGFGSQVSCWLGPPRIHRMITDFSRDVDFPAARAACSARSRPGSESPAMPRKPAFTKPRRFSASVRRNSAHPILLARSELMEIFGGVGRGMVGICCYGEPPSASLHSPDFPAADGTRATAANSTMAGGCCATREVRSAAYGSSLVPCSLSRSSSGSVTRSPTP